MKIVILEPLFIKDEFLENLLQPLKSAGHEIIRYSDRNENDDEIIKRAFDAEILVAGNLPLSSLVIESLPKLKMLSIGFTGVDHIDMATCKNKGITGKNKGITVCNASGYATESFEIRAEIVIQNIVKWLDGNSQNIC